MKHGGTRQPTHSTEGAGACRQQDKMSDAFAPISSGPERCICSAGCETFPTNAPGLKQQVHGEATAFKFIGSHILDPRLAALSLVNASDSVNATACSLHPPQLMLHPTAVADLGSLSSIGVLVLPQWQP